MLRPSIFNKNFAENMFDDFFHDSFWRPIAEPSVSAMSTDIKETETGYQIEMELPGYKREDVQAELEDGYLTIKAAHTEEKEEKDEKKKYIRKERYSGQCERSFFVGETVTEQEIEAQFKDGVLTIHVPKKEVKEAQKEVKSIAIKE